jgi:hypothetical protein
MIRPVPETKRSSSKRPPRRQAAERRAGVSPTCAVCGGSQRCVCTCERQLFREAAELIERAARGEATRVELEAWTAREEQRRREEPEFRRAARALVRGRGLGVAAALRTLIGGMHFVATGTDEQVQLEMRRQSIRVRRQHVTAARAWLAHRWLRPAPSTPRARAGGRS